MPLDAIGWVDGRAAGEPDRFRMPCRTTRRAVGNDGVGTNVIRTGYGSEPVGRPLVAFRRGSVRVFADGSVADRQFVDAYVTAADGTTGVDHGFSVYAFENGDTLTLACDGRRDENGYLGEYAVLGGPERRRRGERATARHWSRQGRPVRATPPPRRADERISRSSLTGAVAGLALVPHLSFRVIDEGAGY